MLRVECYAGHRGDETPRAVVIDNRRAEIVEILARWLSPDHRHFKVRCDDADVYVLRQDVITGDWEVTLFGRHVV